jgi:hypothetical protein
MKRSWEEPQKPPHPSGQKRLQLCSPARLHPRTILVPQNGGELQRPNAMITEDGSGKLERPQLVSPARLHPRTYYADEIWRTDSGLSSKYPLLRLSIPITRHWPSNIASANDFAPPAHENIQPWCGWTRSRWRMERWQNKHRFGISAVSHSASTILGRDSTHLQPALPSPARFDFDAFSFPIPTRVIKTKSQITLLSE